MAKQYLEGSSFTKYICTVSQKDEKTDTTCKMLPQFPHIYISITDWEIQGVKQVLYSYKILFFQTAPLKSYKLSNFLYFKPFSWKIQEIFKNLNKCLVGMEKIHNSGNFNDPNVPLPEHSGKFSQKNWVKWLWRIVRLM